MLFVCQEDGIPRAELETERHRIDRVAGILRENYLLVGAGVDKIPDYVARTFDALGRIAFNTVVDQFCVPVTASTSSAGWKLRIILTDRFDYLSRNKRCAGVIEVDGGPSLLQLC
jgi:hypothetical protein